jgi:hypothetical protein
VWLREKVMLRLACTLFLSALLAVAADVSGNWQITVETSQGSGTPTVVFRQQGEQLTGTYKSQVFGEAALTGTVKGNVVEFSFEGEAGGQQIKAVFKGIIESANAMKGKASYAGLDDAATWSATKK